MPAQSASPPDQTSGAVHSLRPAHSRSALIPASAPAVLVLADGTVFHGRSVGAAGSVFGEVVFDTAMTGYQEILTDPGYCRQIIVLTHPHIGNYGVNPEDVEGAKVHAAGLVVKDVPQRLSNWRSVESLPDYLQREGVPAVAGIDTRQLVRHLRDHGVQMAGLVAAGQPDERIDEDAVRAAVVAAAGGDDPVGEVSAASPYDWSERSWRLGEGFTSLADPAAGMRYRVVALDFGVKRNLLRLLADRDCAVTVMPARSSAADVLARSPEGIFLSNGPGDARACTQAIETVRELIAHGLPVFGVGLGHQLIGLASGAGISRLGVGHRGANHPVRELDSGRVHISRQNHGYVIDSAALPPNLRITHLSLFDGSIQGIERTDRPVFGFQGHPGAGSELAGAAPTGAAPAGPDPSANGAHGLPGLFDRFVAMMEQRR